ncbi:MAG: DEAD/DEAH box helicase [Bifidobacteriaceae bacterium]|nr:DEAD/DEAH box helicase [Bifidobacteriaceae bacterium]
MALPDSFAPATKAWFSGAFEGPTAAQLGAWDAIRQGDHALVVAPTGSGKTLAAFLSAIDHLMSTPPPADRQRRCRVLYVSPLKALAADVERNLRAPLVGISNQLAAAGRRVPDIRVGLRTGDTPAAERRQFATKPPDIFITTPESLFLVLTSGAREGLRGLETVILDEVHVLAGSKRGAHLALSLERLDALLPRPAQRVALSATVRPVEEVARFVRGATVREGPQPRPLDDPVFDGASPVEVVAPRVRPIQIVNPPTAKTIEVSVRLPVEDLTDIGGSALEGELDLSGDAAGGPRGGPSIWPHVHQAIIDQITQHRSTLVFANSRRGAERLVARINEAWAEQVTGEAPDLSALGSTLNNAQSTTVAALPLAVAGEGPLTSRTTSWDYHGSFSQAKGLPVADGATAVALAQAHHGSMSRERRTQIENQLKAGLLPAVVATSSLELGIDMGAIDLVIQVGAPPSAASGLQRIGRAGHQVGAVSHGLMYPVFRGDLVPCAVTAARMQQGQIEALSVPANPLDVLAQQIVAAVAMDTWNLDELARLVRGAAGFEHLGQHSFEAVVDMLAGRYPSADFADLKPRLVWDRATGSLSPRPGAAHLAQVSGGTIPDRGLYGVFLAGDQDRAGGKRVGELDEEMVYESRVGDTFTLGSSTWRIVEITPHAVYVVPAPGLPGRLPFWKGDSPGRPAELGGAIGQFMRATVALEPEAAVAGLVDQGLDPWAAQNLVAYLRDQQEATGVLPDDQTLVVERFQDEIGDQRVMVHSVWGGRVNGAWAAVISQRLQAQYGLDAQVMHSDDGIMLRLPETADEDALRPLDLVLEPDQVMDAVTGALTQTAHFAARFREAAARALILPRKAPGKRQPLWQQRHRAQQLLQVAAGFGDFPIVHEALRESLQDDFDVPALTALMRAVAERRIKVVEVTTQVASPFAKSMAFGYTAQFLYDGDAPLAERRAAALTLDPEMLAELLGTSGGGELADLLDPAVVLQMDAELARQVPERWAGSAEQLADLLRQLGPHDAAGLAAVTVPDDAGTGGVGTGGAVPGGFGPREGQNVTVGTSTETGAVDTDKTASEGGPPPVAPAPWEQWLAELTATRRVIPVRLGGREAWAVIEDAAALRDALGVALPAGLPEQFLAATPDPLGALIRRYIRHHGPFTAAGLAQEFGLGAAVAARELDAMVRAGRLTAGRIRPLEAGGQAGVADYCDPEILSRLRRRSLARLRQQVEPVEAHVLGLFAPRWHQVGRLKGADGVLQAVSALAGAPLPASAIEAVVLPARVAGYQPAMLDELIASGEVFWVGQGRAGGTDGTVRLLLAGTDDAALADVEPPPAGGPAARLLDRLRGGGAFSAHELLERLGTEAGAELTDQDLRDALWELVWGGWVTANSLAPLRAYLAGGTTAHRTTRRVRARTVLPRNSWTPRPEDPRVAGRWSLAPTPTARGEGLSPAQRLAATAAALLERYGVLTKGAAATEVPFAQLYPVLAALEDQGAVRRGYFVEHLGGSQFALPPCPDQLRAAADAPATVVVLAAADPANPYGAALPWPEHPASHRPGRGPGGLVVLVDGYLALYLERGGRTALAFNQGEAAQARLEAAAKALAQRVEAGGIGTLKISRLDGQDALQAHAALSPAVQALVAAGFVVTPQGLVRRGRV